MRDQSSRQKGSWATLVSGATAAVIVGYVSTILIVLKGAEALGATHAQQISVAASTSFGMAICSLILGWRYRMPLIVAWSTPGSALLVASAGAFQGISYAEALGAFVFAGLLMVLTGLLRPLARAIENMPPGIAAAMLAGVLLKFVLAVPAATLNSPILVLPLVAVYFAMRLANSVYAVPLVVVLGVVIAVFTGGIAGQGPLSFTPLVFVMPVFSLHACISIGVPLYLVTMASQNLPGFAVQRAHGYQPPVAASLGVTGFGSMLLAPFGTHAINLAAITASLVTGTDAHGDPGERWKVVIPYFVIYILVGLLAGTFVGTLGALPTDIVAAIAGLALFGPLAGGLAAMMRDPSAGGSPDAAIITFLVTASGVVIGGIGAAFWGLVAGLAYWIVGQALRARSSP
jgi:benzoate membrane transport protein